MGCLGQMKPYKVYVPSMVTVHLDWVYSLLDHIPQGLLGSVENIHTN